ncbi:unnamed protein product [Orchesella dallaii]|uniref:Cell cycle control protein 50A n=1 Tax=Orchesella dallaii TaxID=48710 RepID=A0ABP1QFD1_9HEXA
MGGKASKFRKSSSSSKGRDSVMDENEEPPDYEIIRSDSGSGIIDVVALERTPFPTTSPEEFINSRYKSEPLINSRNSTELRSTPSDTDLTEYASASNVTNRESEPEIVENLQISESYIIPEQSKLSLKTKFSQQKLDGWEPVVNPKTIWKQLSVLGVLVTIAGVCMLIPDIFYANEITIPYSLASECKVVRQDINQLILRGSSCKEKCTHVSDRTCSVEFTVPFDMHTPVFIYYQITNFYQNHRIYTKSKEDPELFGRIYDSRDEPIIPYGCSPAELQDRTGKVYYPCGAVAGSMFSDVFTLENRTGASIPIDESRISFWDFKNLKYAHPPDFDPLNYDKYKNGKFIQDFTWPKQWSEERWKEWFESGGVKSSSFVNWMQPYHSSSVRKLYGSIRGHIAGCQQKGVLCRGSYRLEVKYRFEVDSINGEKSMILATTSFFGTRNLTRGIATVSFGLIALICSVIFFVKQSLYKGTRLPGFLNCLISRRLKRNRVQNTRSDSDSDKI